MEDNHLLPPTSGFFDDSRTGLLEGISHFQGQIELKTTVLAIPEPPLPEEPQSQENEPLFL